MIVIARYLHPLHRTAQCIGIERFGPQRVARLFLREPQVGLRGSDLLLVGACLGAYDLRVEGGSAAATRSSRSIAP